MTVPLYSDHEKPIRCDGNQGLWFERFADFYESDFRILKKKMIDGNEENPGAAWLKNQFNNNRVGDNAQLKRHTAAQSVLATSLQGQSLIFKASGHFVTGMGNSHPVENGFAWHPTLGVPYLTGAAVKGLIRSYLENWLDDSRENKQALLLQWFGSIDKGPQINGGKMQAGELIFFDALPIQPVTLGVDIMTPHMGKWYEKGASHPNQPDTVPADWHDPVPVAFLVAKAITLQFSFALRHSNNDIDLNDVKQALTLALEHAGAGGKTATGYGGMQPLDSTSGALTIQKSEEQWDKATFQYNKGSGEIIATGNKKRASIQGNAAKQLLEKLGNKRTLLEKNRLVATAIVRSQGNLHELLDIK
jgi:CRISPR-associated protein Cmr6